MLLLSIKGAQEGLRIHYTDPAPFVFCEVCESMQTHWNAPQGPEKRVYRNSEVRRSGMICAAGCFIESEKKCISRARAPRERDAWASSIHIVSYSATSTTAVYCGPNLPREGTRKG